MKPTAELIEWVKASNLPWLQWNESNGRLEFFIDNYYLSAYRGCPSYFVKLAIEGVKRRATGGGEARNWFLDFGILFHKMMEVYYRDFRKPEFDLQTFAIDQANKHWHAMKMDAHLQEKECSEMGGIFGFAGMLIQYATQFKAENERIRVLANEVSFGRNREVPIFILGEGLKIDDKGRPETYCEADIYLSGRIDILCDDGFYIFPLDHKTVGNFYGDPLAGWLVDDGPTGYIYAMNSILPTVVPEELILKRQCNRIQMNLISKKVPKDGSRFKRFPIYKTDHQLEAYRQRVVSTCNHILADLESYCRGYDVPRDTSKCNNWYKRQCVYYDIHRQADKDAEEATIRQGYVKLPIWNTEAVKPIGDE